MIYPHIRKGYYYPSTSFQKRAKRGIFHRLTNSRRKSTLTSPGKRMLVSFSPLLMKFYRIINRVLLRQASLERCVIREYFAAVSNEPIFLLHLRKRNMAAGFLAV